MGFIRQLLTAFTLSLLATPALADSVKQCDQPVWQDEFNGSELDAGRWQHVPGDGCDQGLCGWGNGEEQWYLPDNVSVDNGLLRIVAKRQKHAQRQYTSGKISTEGLVAFKYGRIEARMKLPMGEGYWPAFWAMPANSDKQWPLDGEIDFLENSGHTPERVLGAIHFGKTWPNNVHYSESILAPKKWGDDFHVFGVSWNKEEIRWYVDDKEYGVVTPADIAPYPWVFDNKAFYLILNLALGGNLGGEINKAVLPGELLVDYVRVYSAECSYPSN
jgi:beta-glucanase (GH16 family)